MKTRGRLLPLEKNKFYRCGCTRRGTLPMNVAFLYANILEPWTQLSSTPLISLSIFDSTIILGNKLQQITLSLYI